MFAIEKARVQSSCITGEKVRATIRLVYARSLLVRTFVNLTTPRIIHSAKLTFIIPGLHPKPISARRRIITATCVHSLQRSIVVHVAAMRRERIRIVARRIINGARNYSAR